VERQSIFFLGAELLPWLPWLISLRRKDELWLDQLRCVQWVSFWAWVGADLRHLHPLSCTISQRNRCWLPDSGREPSCRWYPGMHFFQIEECGRSTPSYTYHRWGNTWFSYLWYWWPQVPHNRVSHIAQRDKRRCWQTRLAQNLQSRNPIPLPSWTASSLAWDRDAWYLSSASSADLSGCRR
jgi:hypothetical protein